MNDLGESTDTDTDTATDEWYSDGRNVSAVANYYLLTYRCPSGELVRDLFERPWIHDDLWHEYVGSGPEALGWLDG